MKRRYFIKLIGVTGVVSLTSSYSFEINCLSRNNSNQSSPNIVMLYADDLGFGDSIIEKNNN